MKKAQKAEQAAHQAPWLADEKLKKLQAPASSNLDEDTVRCLSAEALSAKEAVLRAGRKAVKGSTKVNTDEKDLQKLQLEICLCKSISIY